MNPPDDQKVSLSIRLWRGAWMVVASALIVVFLYVLIVRRKHPGSEAVASEVHATPPDPVQVTAPGQITIDPTSALQKQLVIATVAQQKVSFPLLAASGSVIARVREGTENLEDRWQFESPDLSETYTEWLRTKNEIEFAESQLKKTQDLAKAEVTYLKATLDRLEPLMQKGSIPEKDFKHAQAELLKGQLTSDKDIYTAQSTLRLAVKSKSALERQLWQAGIEPVVFSRAVEHMVLLVANIPEMKVSQVHEDQPCRVRFYGYPDHIFPAHVESLAANLNNERRVLRVLFELNDPDGVLKPGMFAEVELGTQERETVMVPSDALLHIGRADYVLSRTEPGPWKVTEVRLGDFWQGTFEVLSGLGNQQELITNGVILLKPAVIQAVTAKKNRDT